ncbi:MAG: hypothetical protein ISS67_07790 [Desulfobacterales bacterium]|uniref:Uncharacterized protein n=1 Tax=Candidatus Desulfaltia bathyphila TaxID=2841697 RepID=A0A8J6T9P7_9BACT|nr:hypothetical protein [Candidatus Desulfaltia bathyphila]MBL7208400.1 hypothetical protein [Desulfobacterales bacterium]
MNLSFFLDKNLFNAGTSFFKQLNIPLNSNTTTPLHLKDILKDKFKSQEIFEEVSATCFLGLAHSSVFDAIRALMTPPEKPRKKIGFVVKEKKAAYGKRTKGSRKKK